MKRFSTNLGSLLHAITMHRDLVVRLAAREFEQRFRGSALGLVWAVLTPLLTACVFTFVFSSVFAARWGQKSTGTFDFVILFMLGMAVHSIFAEVVSRSPTLMINNASYVTKVVFPLELLSVVGLATAVTNAAISIVIVLGLQLFLNGTVHPTSALLPVVLVPYLAFVLAVSLILAALGVYLRDLSHLVGLLVTITLFLSPVFYPIEAVPEAFRTWMWLNPLTFIIEQARAVTFLGVWPEWEGLAIYLACSMVLLWFAYWLFQRLRVGFADVL